MSEGVLSSIIQLVGTLLFAVLSFFGGRFFEKKDRNKRKVIASSASVAPLVDPNSLGPISMSVDEAFFRDQATASGVSVPVSSAYSYSIDVTNIGNDDIEKPEIDINLDENSSIVKVVMKAEGMSVDRIQQITDPHKPYFRRVIPDYINKDQTITISVISVNNRDPYCKVIVGGIGITHQTRNSNTESRGGRHWFEWTLGITTIIALLMTAWTLMDVIRPRTELTKIEQQFLLQQQMLSAQETAIWELNQQLNLKMTQQVQLATFGAMATNAVDLQTPTPYSLTSTITPTP